MHRLRGEQIAARYLPFLLLAAIFCPARPSAAQLICENDPTRTIFAGGESGQSGGACRQFDGNPLLCNQAFNLGGNGLVSCFYDAGAMECLGCGPPNEGSSECTNTCRPTPVCEADPTRVFAGPPFSGQQGGACRQHDGNEAACNQAFHLGGNGVASCFFRSDDLCLGCGPNNEGNGDCTDECRPEPVCAGDPTRVFAGPPFSGTSGGACRQHDGNEAACNQAFTFGDVGSTSCFFDEGDCRGCGPSNESDGDCTNVCRTDPGCAGDPSRTIFAGGPGTGACRQFDTDPASCSLAYHQGGDDIVSSCFPSMDCVPCGRAENSDAICINACQPVPTCLDATRTVFAGGPEGSACQNFDGDQAACETAFHLGNSGVASCFYDADDDECLGCGPNNQNAGDCTNTCVPPPPDPTCAGDPTRMNFTGSGFGACEQADNEMLCEQSFFRTPDGDIASCYWDATACSGCRPDDESDEICTNECRTAATTCPGAPTRVFAGPPLSGQGGGACRQHDGNETACNMAYTLGGSGYASCFYDDDADDCLGCGEANAEDGNCINACLPVPPCPDATRTIFAGHPDSEGCRRFNGDSAMCLQAYVEGQAGVASCWYDAEDDVCRGCGPENANDGDCTNTCKPLPVCTEESMRTFGECGELAGDPAACENAFQLGRFGDPIACQAIPTCLGCGLNNQARGLCTNECFAGSGDVGPAPAPVVSGGGLAVMVVALFGLAAIGLRRRARASR